MHEIFKHLSLPKKAAYILLVIVFFSTWVSSAYLRYHYAHTRSDSPQPELGRIYNLKTYGVTKYLTKYERLELAWLAWVWGGCLVIFVLFVAYEIKSLGSKPPQ